MCHYPTRRKKPRNVRLSALSIHESLIHTYIHNWSLQPFSQDYSLASHTHVACVNFYVIGGTYSLTSALNDGFLRNFFMTGLCPLRVFARNLLRGNCRRNTFFHISFWCLIWDMNPGFTSNKLTRYLHSNWTMESLILLLINASSSVKSKVSHTPIVFSNEFYSTWKKVPNKANKFYLPSLTHPTDHCNKIESV